MFNAKHCKTKCRVFGPLTESHIFGPWRLWKIRPSEIIFSQDSIGKKFTDGNSLDGTLGKLLSGDLKIEEIFRESKSPGIATIRSLRV